MIYGIGELVIDCLYSDNKLIGYMGGGTTWNVLYHLALWGHKTMALGFCGKDEWGDEAVKHLSEAGVNVSRIIQSTNISTNRVFLNIKAGVEAKTIAKCPICGTSTWRDHKNKTDIPYALEKGIVIIDEMKIDTLMKAKNLLGCGWDVVQDIGRIGVLRFKSKAEIEKLLSNGFTVVQMTGKVCDYLCKYLGLNCERDIYCFLKCKHLIVTRGSQGARLYTKNDEKHIEAPDVNRIINTVGAGDAFLATYLHNCIIDDTNICEMLPDNFDLSLVSDTLQSIGARKNYKIIENGKDCLCEHKTTKRVASGFNRYRTNVRHIPNRILRALESSAAKEIEKLFSLMNGKKVVFIGAGGSFAAAVYMAQSFCEINDVNLAFAMKPREALQFGLNHFDHIVILSYSGKNNDILQVVAKANELYLDCTLITKANNLIEENNRTELISYNSSARYNPLERGFISIAGVLIPISLTSYGLKRKEYTYIEWHNAFVDRYNHWNNQPILLKNVKLYDLLKVDVFWDRSTLAAAYDLESKIIETGMGRVTLHDKKDFSHGRFSVFEYDPGNVCIYYKSDNSTYEDMLISYLLSKNASDTIVVDLTKGGNIDPCLDAILFNMAWLNKLCEGKQKDLSNPLLSKKSDGLKLYRYKGKID